MKKLTATVMVLIMVMTAVPSSAAVSQDNDAAIEAARKEIEECQAEYDFQVSLRNKMIPYGSEAAIQYSDIGKEFLKAHMRTDEFDTIFQQLSNDPFIKSEGLMDNQLYYASLEQALSVENLIKSSEYVDKCNTIRRQYTGNPLKISYELMALAAVSVSISSRFLFPAVVPKANEGAVTCLYCGHLYENFMVWGETDPFEEWYDKEKNAFDIEWSNNRRYIGTVVPEDLEKENYDLYESIKHCLNIAHKSNRETGFAYVSGVYLPNLSMYEQIFSQDAGYTKAVTPQEFRDELKSYINNIEGVIDATASDFQKQDAIVNKAKEKLDAAKEKLAELTGETVTPTRTRQAPKPTVLRKLTPSSKAFTATWKKQTTGTTGYQIQYSIKKNFKSGAKKVTIKKNTRTKIKIKGLKSRRKYYVRIRTMKKTDFGTAYSSWSKAKTVKTK